MALQTSILDYLNSRELYLLLWEQMFGLKFGFSEGEAFQISIAVASFSEPYKGGVNV